ncbi:MAG: NUDIX hydrolase, partial [Gammaproteobacteria bacterium]|nr:NUDIX hydrolase [Gammaproteobacteria bacterium]
LPSPGFCDEELFLYLAQDLTVGSATPEAHELIELHWQPLDQALQMASGGEIRDAKTVATLFRVAASLSR